MHKIPSQAVIGIIGSGTMGTGIATACLNANLPVILVDKDQENLKKGCQRINDLLFTLVTRGKISEEEYQKRFNLLTQSTDTASLAGADLVIEAVFESLNVKQAVFRELDAICKADAVLATNTSTLNVDKIASATSRPESVVGLHFFSPAHIMKLVEIVRGSNTSQDALAFSEAFTNTINKTGVIVGNEFGFVGNRMLYGYGRENQLLLLEGAEPDFIDAVLVDWGMAMGPNAVGDLSGMDIGYSVRKEHPHLMRDPRYYRTANVLVEMGRLGQKTGKGMFAYQQGSNTPIPDPEVSAIIRAEAEKLGIHRREITPQEIIQRCIYALVVEGARLLEKGIAGSAADIDLIWTHGYGFPKSRGGPMTFADETGLKAILQKIREFDERCEYGYWTPPDLLINLVNNGQTFSDLSSTPE